ncbi:hypothetical protein N5A93_11580 [Roseovarius sp. EGI FJ00037]|uniref:hypothetical protein n=1 Tax=Roseovarius TaxID=74030 RepID=UPI0022A88DD2|nr:hypothetical protein [Roseovarius sp. EGI FJ00037]MCZ0812874.1 hypothetical protein [Roseovarius sp. EGI FJ00037]
MSSERGPVFLERRTYRRRRMADAARLLPILGAALFGLPLLWGIEGEATPTTRVMFYIFSTWLVLTVLTAVISRYLRQEKQDPPDTGEW